MLKILLYYIQSHFYHWGECRPNGLIILVENEVHDNKGYEQYADFSYS